MKILYIFRDINQQGGVPYEVRSLINSVINEGHKVIILTSETKNKINKQIELNADIRQLGGNYFEKKRSIAKIITEFNPDYAHFFSGWIPFNFLCWLTVMKKNIPYIISLHGVMTPYIMEKRFGGKTNYPGFRILKRLYSILIDKKIFEQSIAIHCLSKYEENICSKIFDKKKLILAPNGVDKHLIKNIEYLRGKNIICRFIFLGRLDIYQKGLDILLDSIKILKDTGHTLFSLDLIGPEINNSKTKILKKIGDLNLENVHLKNPILTNDLNVILSEYDYLLLPSRFEGLARVVREAVINAIPVIASKESNFGDWVSEYNMGFCIEQLTPESLATTLKNAMDVDASTYYKLKENSLIWAKEFCWERVAKIINSEMSRILKC